MIRRALLVLALAALAGVASAQAPAMTVRQFVEIAGSTPRNPLSLMRPSVRRAWDAMEGSINAARFEEAQARTSGQTPPFCIPATTNISPNDFIARMRAVPATQQDQSVTRAVRSWMVQRFPCRQ
jgi:hypothetical protein